jgi:alkanesulfonate monooxygenase SsuD/methylene tetrahydromethanopterin reductase-like flavin-dependent oxidoreductase (luciferase family)
MEIGVDSFVAATVDAVGRAVDPARHLNELLEAITLADEVGLDVFGSGEYHRREFLDSAPTVILAAAAARTRRIRLTSAVTVLSAADPVRVFQEFATLDLLPNGRAEIVAGGAHSSKHFRSSASNSRTTIRSLPRNSICF